MAAATNPFSPWSCRLICGLSLACFLSACSERDQIRHYTVERMESAPEPPSVPTRMLGGILAHEKTGWFFKVSGADRIVEPLAEPFRTFLRSVDFAADGRPKWKLPDGWKEIASSSPLRYKTIAIPAEPKSLELTVSELQIPGDTTAFALSNLNRWRGQLSLAPIEESQLDSETEKLEAPGGTVLYVNYSGKSSAGGGMPPMMAGGNAPSAPPSAPRSAAKPKSPLQFQTPSDWKPAQGTSLSVAAFQAQHEGQSVTITITPAGGDLIANVNRWRGQIQLPAASADEIKNSSRSLTVDKRPVVIVELMNENGNPPQAIFAAILNDGGQTWFIKLSGDAAAAKQEQSNFDSFVQSIRFEG